MCSTPFGITEVLTEGLSNLRVSAYNTCSTPFGITEVLTLSCLFRGAPLHGGAQRLSASQRFSLDIDLLKQPLH